MKKTILLLLILAPQFIIAQSMYDNWIAGKKAWKIDYGITVGANTGLQLQFSQPRANRCKYLLKKQAIETGLYYEGLIFKNNLAKQLPNWQSGGIRAELSYLYYPKIMVPYFRSFIGVGVESGSRKIDGDTKINTDLIGKFGLEILINPKSGPIFFRLSGKYNYCLSNDFRYFLPELSIIFGR